MRDLLLLGIVIVAVLFALRHTWIGILLWTWLSVMNPHKLAFGFAYDAPLAAVAAGVVLLSLVITRDKLRMTWAPPVIVLLLFVVWMCLTTIFAIDPAGSSTQLTKVLKIQLMTFVAVMALQERKHIDLFIWVIIISIGFFGFKGGIFTIAHGGSARVWGPPGGFIEDNNTLAVAVVMVIPLMNYLRIVTARRSVRFGLLALMLLCAISALGSQSRGALLAISAMGLVLWYRSENRVSTGLVIAVTVGALLAFMPDSWEQRMGTIKTYEEDSSAMSRLVAWRFCLNLANHLPFGGGFDVYNWTTYKIYAPPEATAPQAAHSIYFSALGEHGYVGLILFLLIWWLTFRLAGALRQDAKSRPDIVWVYALAGMCQVSLVGYLVGGAFLQLAYFDLPYDIMVILVVTQRWLRDNSSKQEAVDPSRPAVSARLEVLPTTGSSTRGLPT